MSTIRSRTVTVWPAATALRGQFAKQARRAAEQRQTETGWTDEETALRVRAAATEAAECIAAALVDAAEMALDLWRVTK